MNKICTSIEQSKKLIELGLDVNTADMCWTNHLFNAFLSSNRIESTPPQEYKNLLDGFLVRGYFIEPAWSLSALLDILPLTIDDDDFNYDLKIDMEDKMPRYVVFGDCYHTSFPWDFEKDTLLDNVVESIIWLNDNNYLKIKIEL